MFQDRQEAAEGETERNCGEGKEKGKIAEGRKRRRLEEISEHWNIGQEMVLEGGKTRGKSQCSSSVLFAVTVFTVKFPKCTQLRCMLTEVRT